MPVSSNVTQFLEKVKSGVKPNLFRVDLEYPSSLSASNQDLELTTFLCKAAALPASNMGVIEVPFRGRVLKVSGDRTFDTWTVTIINDVDFRIRSLMEKWMRGMNAHAENTAELFSPDSTNQGYHRDLVVHQLGRSGVDQSSNYVRSIKLFGCFPTNISQIDLAYDSNDQIEEYTVEFQVQYWQSGNNNTFTDIT